MELDDLINEAFNHQDVATFSELIRAHPEFLRHEDGTDRWMWAAARRGSLALLQALVDLGMNVNESTDHEDPDDPDDPFYQAEGCIIEAASQGHLQVVQWLLDQGARINYIVQGMPRCLPLERAATNGHLDVVNLLVKHRADIHATWRGADAITQAEDYGQFAVRDYLHSLGARTLRERTPPDHPRSHVRFLKELTSRVGPLGEWKLEIAGDPLVTLHTIPANGKCDIQSLFTVGLSDRPLPQGPKKHACAELRCLLPADWPLDSAALHDPLWNWPVEWLKKLVSDLRSADRWAEEPVMFMNGNPPNPLAPNTALSGWLCLKSVGESVHAPDYRWIDMHSLFPIYAEEREIVLRSGYEELLGCLQARNVPLYIDPQRPNMATSQ